MFCCDNHPRRDEVYLAVLRVSQEAGSVGQSRCAILDECVFFFIAGGQDTHGCGGKSRLPLPPAVPGSALGGLSDDGRTSPLPSILDVPYWDGRYSSIPPPAVR